MAQEVKLYQKKTRLIAGGVGMAAASVGLVVMIAIGPNPDSVFRPFRSPAIVYTLGVVGLALCLYILSIAIKGLRNPSPKVVISDAGVVVDGFSGRFSAGWDEFQGFALKDNSIYVLVMKEAEQYIARLPTGRSQQTAKALSARFGSPFLIETSMIDADIATIQRGLSAHLPELRG